MSNRRFEMYEYRQIIYRLRQGESIRGVATAKLADRKKVRKIYQTAEEAGWLNLERELPTDSELLALLKPQQINRQKSLASAYHAEIEAWVKQGIQATTIHATLQRRYQFSGAYNSVQRLVKAIKNRLSPTTMMIDFEPGVCAQVDFGAGPKIMDEVTGLEIKTWIFVMVLAWSRHM